MKFSPKIIACMALLLMAAVPPWRHDGLWLRESTGQAATPAMDFGLDRWYFGFQRHYHPLWSPPNIAAAHGTRIEWKRHAMYQLQSQSWSIDWLLLGLQGLPLALLLRRD